MITTGYGYEYTIGHKIRYSQLFTCSCFILIKQRTLMKIS
jgi:hypothetical protein